MRTNPQQGSASGQRPAHVQQWRVFRISEGYRQPISRAFAQLAQAKRYASELPKDWTVEVAEA